jgi:hypothetical protein
VNHEQPLDITTSPGFSYVTNGATGSLTVQLDGYLFCSNIGQPPAPPTAVTVIPQHGQWTLPMAQDVYSVGYNVGVLSVNHSNQTTLVCHGVGAEGETRSPYSDGLLRYGLEKKEVEQFQNLVNWVPPQGYSWNAPDWTIVPKDPCNPADGETPEVNENIACAAVTGVRPAGAGTNRAATMWTGTDGSNFFYVVRIDARYGAGTQADRSMHVPSNLGASAPNSGFNAALEITEAYDGGIAGGGTGYLSDSGTWCALESLPSVLSPSMCAGSPYSAALSGPLSQVVYLQSEPVGPASVAFYLAFIRPIGGAPPVSNQPAAAVSVLFEPSISAEHGDTFTGDDVAFGFLPSSTGFPWMTGGQ